MTSRSDAALPAELPALPVDEAAIREIIADVDRVTRGRRRIDVAHALLSMVGTEIASNAPTIAVAKSRGQVVARQLKVFVREQWAALRVRGGVH